MLDFHGCAFKIPLLWQVIPPSTNIFLFLQIHTFFGSYSLSSEIRNISGVIDGNSKKLITYSFIQGIGNSSDATPALGGPKWQLTVVGPPYIHLFFKFGGSSPKQRRLWTRKGKRMFVSNFFLLNIVIISSAVDNCRHHLCYEERLCFAICHYITKLFREVISSYLL